MDGTLSAATGEPNDGEDCISALPDDLRRKIVSHLPVKDAVRTTALSTRWCRVWHSTPLVFYDSHLDPEDEPARVAAVDRVLAGHPGPFHTVHLTVCSFDKHECELDRWSRLLAAGGVRNLALVSLPRRMVLLRLPVDILRCAKLEPLYLGCWRFPDTAADLPDGTGVFPYLRELTMVRTFFEDRDLDHMLASSPVLETLALCCVSFGKAKHVRLRGQRLQCVLFCESMAFDLELVDSPLLKRLIMWDTNRPAPGGDVSLMGVRIPKDAPELKVLGYLEPRVHELRIRNTIIKADTEVSPRIMVPSVKILALKVNLGVVKEVKMLFSFIRCFPNIETLHVESAHVDEPTGKDYVDFFWELSPIECVSHIKMVVLHEIYGDISEVMFINDITQGANELKKLTLVLSDKRKATVGEMIYVVKTLAIPPWASETCMVLLMAPKEEQGSNFHRASDLSVEDPFLEHGQELFHFTKRANKEHGHQYNMVRIPFEQTMEGI